MQLFHDENGHRAMERRDQTNVNSKRHNEMIDVPPINPIHRSYKPSLPSWGESIVPLIDQDLKPEKKHGVSSLPSPQENIGPQKDTESRVSETSWQIFGDVSSRNFRVSNFSLSFWG